MSDIITPDMIAAELRSIVSAIESGPDALKHAETAYNLAEAAWQDAYDEAYLDATGTIAEREIAGRRATTGYLTDTRNERRAELSRVKQKIRSLESHVSNLQTQLKAVMVTYDQAGR